MCCCCLAPAMIPNVFAVVSLLKRISDLKRTQKCLQLFAGGSSCAQAVLSTYLPLYGISAETAHRMGAGLGGGLGRKQLVCGALNGTAIVLSMATGNAHPEDQEAKEKAREQVHAFISGFEQEFGATSCSRLTGVDFSTEAGREQAQELNISRRVCDGCVRFCAEYLETFLETQPV